LFVSFAAHAIAQTEGAKRAQAEVKAARSEDVASIEAIVKALYDVISGPAGQKRDWDRMRSLFAPEAKMAATVKRQDGSVGKRSFSVEEYISMNAKPMEEGGFFEKGIANHVDQYGQIAHVFSSYEARRTLSEEKPFMRGINSLSLWNDGKRWWILSIIWQAESPGNPVPEKYLKDG
jgi:hypothetical protein